ncbi:hypothetical protein BC833DRAFT_579567 [Globomyces pollinis-pini]|nr:hypothetical protein BC833DRAFT_579567 [Globomyces pollinis-pini]KAJ2994855.1 hypothetical protein HDV02_001267 [Globomyces sp. JEL0801]
MSSNRWSGSTWNNNTSAKHNWPFYHILICGFMCFVIVILEMIVVLLTLKFLNGTFTNEQSGSAPIIITYFGLFICSMVFQFVWAIDANEHRNTFQIIAISIFNILSVFYSILQISQMWKLKFCSTMLTTIADKKNTAEEFIDFQQQCYFNVNIKQDSLIKLSASIKEYIGILDIAKLLEYVIGALMIGACILECYVAYKCFLEYGWEVFRIAGASVAKKKMLQRYHLFLIFLKINIYLFFGVAAQFFFALYFDLKSNGDSKMDPMYLWMVGSIIVLVSILYYVVGYFAANRGNYILMMVFIFLVLCNSMALNFVFYWTYHSANFKHFQATIIGLTSFAVLDYIMVIAIGILSVFLILDFDDGLSEIVSFLQNHKNEVGNEDESQYSPISSRTKSVRTRFEFD